MACGGLHGSGNLVGEQWPLIWAPFPHQTPKHQALHSSYIPPSPCRARWCPLFPPSLLLELHWGWAMPFLPPFPMAAPGLGQAPCGRARFGQATPPTPGLGLLLPPSPDWGPAVSHPAPHGQMGLAAPAPGSSLGPLSISSLQMN